MFCATALLSCAVSLGAPGDDAEARGLLFGLAERLQTDRGVVDSITVSGRGRGVAQRESIRFALGQELTGTLTHGRVTAVIEEDFASVTHADRPDELFVAETDEEFFEVLLGIRALPMRVLPHLALRAAEDEEMALEAFFVGWDDELEIAGMTPVKVDGRALQEITLKHVDWEERVLVDPAGPTLVRRTATRGDVELSIDHSVVVSAEEAPVISFDAGDREQADDLMNVLFAAAGERAMLFAAPTLDGGTVSLDDARRDSVVVLDFWATWCVPCAGGLRQIQGFVDEAKKEGIDVQVYAVNVSERLEPDERIDKVKAYWERAGYTFPVLLDLDDSIRIAYRAATIPVTAVIGRDGKVHAIHKDVSPGLGEWLMDSVRSASEGSR